MARRRPAPPLRAGALWPAGFVAHSLQTAAGMVVIRASPASQNALQQNRKLFLHGPLVWPKQILVFALESENRELNN